MGSFSWLRADKTTNRKNLTMGDDYKILIPEKFGGGYIFDTYYDYGYVFSDMVNSENQSKRGYYDPQGNFIPMSTFGTNDLYGILAYWNSKRELNYLSITRPNHITGILKNGLTCDDTNREIGIDIGCYDREIEVLEYPLKLVSVEYNGTYEECDMRSYSDPNQGFFPTHWE